MLNLRDTIDNFIRYILIIIELLATGLIAVIFRPKSSMVLILRRSRLQEVDFRVVCLTNVCVAILIDFTSTSVGTEAGSRLVSVQAAFSQAQFIVSVFSVYGGLFIISHISSWIRNPTWNRRRLRNLSMLVLSYSLLWVATFPVFLDLVFYQARWQPTQQIILGTIVVAVVALVSLTLFRGESRTFRVPVRAVQAFLRGLVSSATLAATIFMIHRQLIDPEYVTNPVTNMRLLQKHDIQCSVNYSAEETNMLISIISNNAHKSAAEIPSIKFRIGRTMERNGEPLSIRLPDVILTNKELLESGGLILKPDETRILTKVVSIAPAEASQLKQGDAISCSPSFD